MKKVLNFSEVLTDRRLSEVCERNGARVFPKMRLADALPIKGSGIRGELFGFALRSHFDFLVADQDQQPLFGVEFDGPSHEDERQARRDALKDEICSHFELPLLRINSFYLESKYRSLDLLTWIVERWFAEQALAEAQARGALPDDECFDPAFMFSMPGYKNRFPLWLCAEPLLEIRKLQKEGRCADMIPSWIIGIDPQGNHRAFGYLRINGETAISITTGMKSQKFPILEFEFLDEIIPFQILDRLREVLEGRSPAISLAALQQQIDEFCNRVSVQIRTSHRSPAASSPPAALR